MLATAFSGWLFAGVLMSITSIAAQPAMVDLLAQSGQLDRLQFDSLNSRSLMVTPSSHAGAELSEEEMRLRTRWRALVTAWVSWLKCSLLFGAAAGGLLFGMLGDRCGRVRGMGCSILTYSAMTGLAWFANSPVQLCVCWFVACTGVGGMWPNGAALVSEAWASLSRPVAAGVIGTAANFGIFSMSSIAAAVAVTTTDWRWVLLIGAAPVVLGLFVLMCVAESPAWLASREQSARSSNARAQGEIFRPPFLGVTFMGIALATIPAVGGWGSADWMIQWAAETGAASSPPNPTLKAHVSQARSMAGIVGSCVGGWIAITLGRRWTFFVASLGSLVSAQYAFWWLTPLDGTFLWWVAALGFCNGVYFGWLPLCLPELFPTRIRAAGSGVSFNFGRIISAVTVFATGTLMDHFQGDYAVIGRFTSLIFVIGMLLAGLAPDTFRRRIED